jgi:hypothetical protein
MEEAYVEVIAVLGGSRKFAGSEIMLLAGCYGVRLASFQDGIPCVSMCLAQFISHQRMRRMMVRQEKFPIPGSRGRPPCC